MADVPSFNELLVFVGAIAMFVGWVVSDVLEEQLLGKTRRERQAAVRARRKAAARKAVPPPPRRWGERAPLPRAQVHRRRDMHAA